MYRMVGVFDTAFHQTMPARSISLRTSAMNIYKKYKVRRYGFHGTSHSFVSKRAVEFLGLDIRQLQRLSFATLETDLPSALL